MTVPKKEQNAGVALLLERMKTNPEEFCAENEMRMGQGKWRKVWELYGKYLSEEDQEAYINGLKEINQQRFTEHVLEGLVDPKVSSGAESQYSTTPSATHLGGATQGLYSNGIGGNAQLQQAQAAQNTQLHQLLHMKAQMELERSKAKQHQTLFGKLKNYLHDDK